MRVRGIGAALVIALASAAFASEMDWAPLREEEVVEILTSDANGALRETPVWVVVVDDAAYVRTNESRWLANIRRGSPVRLRAREVESAMAPSEVADEALKSRVEEAFKAKYGTLQRVMSALRLREPTVIALQPKR